MLNREIEAMIRIIQILLCLTVYYMRHNKERRVRCVRKTVIM